MATVAIATYTKIFMKKITKKEKQLDMRHFCCSKCGKKPKFVKRSENPLTCWQCMILNADS
jgi:ribosomal protein L37AE/L43A